MIFWLVTGCEYSVCVREVRVWHVIASLPQPTKALLFPNYISNASHYRHLSATTGSTAAAHGQAHGVGRVVPIEVRLELSNGPAPLRVRSEVGHGSVGRFHRQPKLGTHGEDNQATYYLHPTIYVVS